MIIIGVKHHSDPAGHELQEVGAGGGEVGTRARVRGQPLQIGEHHGPTTALARVPDQHPRLLGSLGVHGRFVEDRMELLVRTLTRPHLPRGPDQERFACRLGNLASGHDFAPR